MKWLKALVVLRVLLVAGLHIGAWSIDSWSTPRATKLPARYPIALNDLQQALDAEFAAVVRNGLLKPSTGCGVAIGIIDHGQRRLFTYGAAHADSIFEIGSVTKTFTGLALAQLAAQGKVRLDQPVRPLLFPDNLPAAPISGEITLLDLITHRSGLPSVPGNLVLTDPGNPFGDYNPVALREFFGSRATQRPADAKYSYSSFGIALLGFALAQREGITYSQLISTEITGPLRMKDTMFALSPEQSRRVVQGHSANLDPVEAELGDSGIFAGAVGAKSTVGDLLIYLDANLHPDHYSAGADPTSPAATLPDAIAVDHQLRGNVTADTQVAFSWLYDSKSGRFEHGGATPGFTARVEFSPGEDRGIVVLYNRMDESLGQERFVDRVAENIDELMSGKPAARIDQISDCDPALAALNQGENDL